VESCHSKRRAHPKWRAAVITGALSAALLTTAPDFARAQGFFDFLFGGPQQRPAPPPVYDAHPPPPPGIGRIAPAPLGQESVNENAGSTGHGVAFCVRLCDGQHFPLEKIAGTPVETCRAICPYSNTKVFFGSEIGGAVAEDGQKYTNLSTAFVYRKQLVANCSCNGRDAFGLATFDVKNDPTLRPGDIVSTKEGLLDYTGKSGQAAGFAPVNPATLPPDISPGSSQTRPAPSTVPVAAGDKPATTVQTGKPPPQAAPPVANPQGHGTR
jgi:hypothetical protein